MSTFDGLIREYPQIAIDYFSGKNVLKARAYFLSHVHTDHMVGLQSSTFSNHLEKHPSHKLYCSEVTKEFLLTSRKHRHLERSLVALPVLQTCNVVIPNEITGENEKLQITLLPAGHCPGSVMFLLEGDAGNVLYTGDFRLKKTDVTSFEALHSGTGVKPLQSLYIDTTFFDPKVMFIPSREQSCAAMLDLIEEQIERGSDHMVHIKCRAKYGYEYLFVEISKAFGMKVHVSEEIMEQYKRVPELAMHMTTEGSRTQVHACRKYNCVIGEAENVITILPSTMWFNSNAQPDDVLRRISSSMYRLCFSFHSSYSEICDFIQHLKPNNIYPNVIPYNSTEYDMIERLQEVLKKAPGPQINTETNAEHFKPLGQLRLGKKRKRKRVMPGGEVHNKSLEELFEEETSKNIKDAGESHAELNSLDEDGYQAKERKGVADLGVGSWADEEYEGGTSDSLFSEEESDEDVALPEEKASVIKEENVSSSTKKENGIDKRLVESEDDSQYSFSPIKSFSKYLPKFIAKTVTSPQLEKKDPHCIQMEEDSVIQTENLSGESQGRSSPCKGSPEQGVRENSGENFALLQNGNGEKSKVREVNEICSEASEESSQESLSPCKSFLKYLPKKPSLTPGDGIEKHLVSGANDYVNVEGDRKIGQSIESDLKVKQDVVIIDLTELKSSQSSEETYMDSQSRKSSQETYLSPTKFANGSQDLFLSSPASSDATPDCIKLL